MTDDALDEARARIDEVRAALDPGKGRMVGVLIGQTPDGRRVVLQAYSGTTHLPRLGLGWAAPTRRADETEAEERVTFARLEALSAELEELRWPEVREAFDVAQAAYREGHAALKAARNTAKAQRAALRSASPDDTALHAQLQNESWDAGVRYKEALSALREPLERERQRHDAVRSRLQALRAERKRLSRRLQTSFDETHTLTNFRGVSLTPEEASVDGQVPPGTGECAAPKLLQDAARRGVRPLALAEVWVGAAQSEPSRVEGRAYGPCAERCQRILGHMLCGASRPRPAELNLTIVGSGEGWVAVSKPGGLLSTPGRGEEKRDSVQTRVRRCWGRGAQARAVHRLDMETSGVMLLAVDAESQGALQEQFAERSIEKTYLAWVEGELEPGAAGAVVLPLGPDAGGRRQIVDPVAGREAVSDYVVLGSSRGRSLVEFRPRTGRTHQLRVHAVEGLGHPIVGDSRYGSAGGEGPLLLHAWKLVFRDPSTGERVAVECPVPDGWPEETVTLAQRVI